MAEPAQEIAEIIILTNFPYCRLSLFILSLVDFFGIRTKVRVDKSPSDKMSDFCPLGLLSYDMSGQDGLGQVRTGQDRSMTMTDQDMLGLVRTG